MDFSKIDLHLKIICFDIVRERERDISEFVTVLDKRILIFQVIIPISLEEGASNSFGTEKVSLLVRRLADQEIPGNPLLSLNTFLSENRSWLLSVNMASSLADGLNFVGPVHFRMCFSSVLGIEKGMSQSRHFMMSFPIRP